MSESESERLSPTAGLSQHSTLELAKHDVTTKAPERDNAVVAPEYNRELDAPQTALEPGPETFYSDSPPEALTTTEEVKSTETDTQATPVFHHLSRRAIIVISATIAAVVVGAAVGAGVGVGHKVRNPSRNPPITLASTVTTTATSSPTSSVSPLLTNKRILDDTSLAVLGLPNEDRRLFFQDLSGIIRQGFYSSSAREWRADLSYVVASNAKNRTPIAAVTTPDSWDNSTSAHSVVVGGLAVFYISSNNSLACVQLIQGAWVGSTDPDPPIYFANVSQFTAVESSRHLSVTIVPGKGFLNALLFYESTHEGITMLNGSLTILPSSSQSPSNLTLSPPSHPVWTWQNSSSKLRASRQQTSLQFGAPFTTYFGGGSNQALFAGKYENESYSEQALMAILYGDGSGLNTYNYTENFVPAAIQKSDLVMIELNRTFSSSTDDSQDYGFWVNGTVLTPLSTGFNSLPGTPNSPFPFTRLAGFSPANSTSFFIYHQLNASTFAEDEWDESVGGWVSNPFTISTA